MRINHMKHSSVGSPGCIKICSEYIIHATDEKVLIHLYFIHWLHLSNLLVLRICLGFGDEFEYIRRAFYETDSMRQNRISRTSLTWAPCVNIHMFYQHGYTFFKDVEFALSYNYVTYGICACHKTIATTPNSHAFHSVWYPWTVNVQHNNRGKYQYIMQNSIVLC